MGASVVENTVEEMVSVGEKHRVSEKLKPCVNNYGHLVSSIWEKKGNPETRSLCDLTEVDTLRAFFAELMSKMGIEQEDVVLKEGYYRMSTSFVPKVYYRQESEDKVCIYFNSSHKIYEGNSDPSNSIELVEDIQKAMTVLLVMLDLCGAGDVSRMVIDGEGLWITHDGYGSPNYVLSLTLGMSFDVRRASFEKLESVLSGFEKLPWLLSKSNGSGSGHVGGGDLCMKLRDADQAAWDFLEPLCGAESSSSASEPSDE